MIVKANLSARQFNGCWNRKLNSQVVGFCFFVVVFLLLSLLPYFVQVSNSEPLNHFMKWGLQHFALFLKVKIHIT